MPAYKNQHFTPRILLKPFTLNAEGRAINLFALKSRRLIPNAPAKNQCARDYLYGKDGAIEKGLSKIEGRYGRAFDAVVNHSDTDEDRETLKFFAHLQLRRTEMAFTRVAAQQQGFFFEVFGLNAPEKPSLQYFMIQSLKLVTETHDRLIDLKVRIAENRTKTDFVISDDPAVLTNKYVMQKLGRSNFGLTASGVVLIMPLSPRLALVCYDGLVYTIPNLASGRIVIQKSADVDALNELQFINASENVYFSTWSQGQDLVSKFDKVSSHRSDETAVFTHLILVEKKADGTEVYRAGTKEEAEKTERSIIKSTFLYPRPPRWISGLKYRSPVKTFSNGTEVGHVRNEAWLTS